MRKSRIEKQRQRKKEEAMNKQTEEEAMKL